ncbi:MAG TPA: S41 family peptidase, partial [Myxococcota bacterium]|nr:S41 family peptidase [Myxococcota bacterium]
ALACGCTAIDPYNVVGRQMVGEDYAPIQVVPDPPSRTLRAEARERAFDFVWRTVSERYHDPDLNGVDWKAVGERYRPLALAAADDEAFWDVLDRMAGELKDSHTRVESPARVALRKRDESISLGISLRLLEGALVVTGVATQSDAYFAGVRPGMRVVAISGEPALRAYDRVLAETRFDSTDRARHQRAVRQLVTGPEGGSVDFTFERHDGTRFDARLERRKAVFRPTSSYRRLPSGFGYIRLTQWRIGVMPRALAGVEALKDAPGIIVDLRNNPGGSVHAVNAMLSRFFPSPAHLGDTTTRTGEPVSMFFGAVEIIKLKTEIEGRADAYAGPVAVLVNGPSASGSELFAGTMQASGRAVVVGEPTCGCMLGFLGYARIPGGAELAYSEVGFVMPNGKRIEGEGVLPNHHVPTTIEDLRTSRDRALEAAQEVLRQMPAWKP